MGYLNSIDKFKANLVGGGARPNLFAVELPTLPTIVGKGWDSDLFTFTCKSANMPASNIAAIEVPVRGKTLKIPGDRTFDPWTVTVINTEDFKLRKLFEKWVEAIVDMNEGQGSPSPSSYQTDATVFQLGREDKKVSGRDYKAGYKFYGIYPSSVSAIEVSYDDTDTIEEFTVEFQVQYWAPA